MQPEFWQARWSEGQIGFHQAEYNRHLLRFVDTMPRPEGGRVLVPLAGKTKDLTLLTERGHEVVAVELVEVAAASYFHERGAPFSRRIGSGYPVLEGAGVEAHVTDFFEVDPERVGPFDWIFDRAALVALPPEMRASYVPHLVRFVEAGGQALVVTFGYAQEAVSGPPFSVPDEEVEARLSPHGRLERLAHEELIERAPPKFRQAGLSSFTESVWRFTKA